MAIRTQYHTVAIGGWAPGYSVALEGHFFVCFWAEFAFRVFLFHASSISSQFADFFRMIKVRNLFCSYEVRWKIAIADFPPKTEAKLRFAKWHSMDFVYPSAQIWDCSQICEHNLKIQKKKDPDFLPRFSGPVFSCIFCVNRVHFCCWE